MAFGNDPNAPRSSWEARLSEAASRIELEVRNIVRTVDDEVVPEIRKHGSAALHSLAAQMEKLAQKMDDEARAEKPPRKPPYTPPGNWP